MELQPTETENLYALFIVKSIANILMNKDNKLNFYIPISMVDANFERALRMNALLEEKFFFRVNVFESGVPEILELSIKDYLCGCVSYLSLCLVCFQRPHDHHHGHQFPESLSLREGESGETECLCVREVFGEDPHDGFFHQRLYSESP